jgi:hypothetical protein
MELEGSLLCSQDLATGLILSQLNMVHTFPFCFFKINFDIILLHLSHSSGLLPSGPLTKTLYAFLLYRVTSYIRIFLL